MSGERKVLVSGVNSRSEHSLEEVIRASLAAANDAWISATSTFTVPTAPPQSTRPAADPESAQRRTAARDRARIAGGRCVPDTVASAGHRRGRVATAWLRAP